MTETPTAKDLLPRPEDFDHWVLWRHETRDDKPTKVLYQPQISGDLVRARVNDEETWGTYKQARAIAARRDDVDGIGFVFTADDPFCGIDLDSTKDEEGNVVSSVIDEETARVEPWAREILNKLDSYTEISPSGTGIHVIVQATLLPDLRHRSRPTDERKIELYDSGRFFTWTGKMLSTYGPGCNDRQAQVEELQRSLAPPEEVRRTPPPQGDAPLLTDQELLGKAMAAQNGALFRGLYAGDTSHSGGDHSAADQSLCNLITFWTDDPEQADRIFRGSGLMRPKWDKRHHADGRTYGQGTIDRAFSDRIDRWTPPSRDSRDSRDGDSRGNHGNSRGNDRGNDKNGTVGTVGTVSSREKKEKRKALAPAVPFPVEALPDSIHTFIKENVAALNCAPDLLAMPILGVLSAAIGTSRIIEVKRRFTQLASLFLCVVAPPGAMKSPAAGPAIEPLEDLQARYEREYLVQKNTYEERLRAYEVDKALARKENTAAPAPPEPPVMKRTLASDTTVEALVGILKQNERGLFVFRDELAGWVRSHDQYKGGGKGSDRQHWLSIHDSKSITVDRRSSLSEPIIVRRPFVTLFGGIQPPMLAELGGGMQDGLMDRFLFSYPATRYVTFSHDVPSRATEIAYENLYDDLTKLSPARDARGYDVPKSVPMTFDALRLYEDEFNRYSLETIQPGFPSILDAQWAKSRGHLARLSLILAVCRSVKDKKSADDERCEREDVERAALLMHYFQAHAKRVYGVLEDLDPEELLASELKSLLADEEDSTWIGTATDLLDELEARGVEDLPPDAARMGQMLRAVVARNPLLHVATKKRDSNRLIKLTLKTAVETVRNTVVTVPTVPQAGSDGTVGTVGTVDLAETNEKEEEARNPNDKCHHDIAWVECYACNPDHPKRHKPLGWGEG